MYKLINNLTVNSRLRVVSILILIFSFACVLLLWNTSSSFNNDLQEINDLTDLELKMWQIRNNYNSMRGDIMQVFIADPVTQHAYVREASTQMLERIDQIKSYNAAIDIKKLDPETIKIYERFNVLLQNYITFCADNLPAVQKVILTDSVEFNRIRNVLVVDLDNHFQILRAQAILVLNAVQAHKTNVYQTLDHRRRNSLAFTLMLSASLLVVTILIIMAISKSILSPIKETEQILHSLSSGELPDIKDYDGKDEFSRMLRSLKLFNSHIHLLMDFVRSVAQNNFSVQAQMFEGQGPIAASLVSMRDNLQVAYTSESQRTWSSQGIADLGELIRRQENSATLYDGVISFIVKYLSANQGALYILDDTKKSLDMVAAYAYGRKKHITSSIGVGEGLVGQAYLEGALMVLKEVPKNYIKITSGLGEALPSVLVISPLISNNEGFGVLELASFTAFEPHKLEFIKKISEELAAIIRSTNVNTSTQALLRESQQQSEELKSQEEEMRQNMEELQATQEGMNRMLKEVQAKEDIFNKALDTIQVPVLIFDTHYKVVQVNKSMKKLYATSGSSVDAGANLLEVLKNGATEMKPAFDRALQGETFQQQHTVFENGATTGIVHYTNIRNTDGKITAGVAIAYEH